MTTYHTYGNSAYSHPATGNALADYLVSGIPVYRNAVKGIDANAVVVNEKSDTAKVRKLQIATLDSVILPRAINSQHARALRTLLASDLLADLELVKEIYPFIPNGYQIRAIIPSNELLVGMTINSEIFISIERIGRPIKPLTVEQIARQAANRERNALRKQQELADYSLRVERVATTDSEGNVTAIRTLTQLEAETAALEYLASLKLSLAEHETRKGTEEKRLAKIEHLLQNMAIERRLSLARIKFHEDEAAKSNAVLK